MVGLYVLFEPTREKTGGLWWICFSPRNAQIPRASRIPDIVPTQRAAPLFQGRQQTLPLQPLRPHRTQIPIQPTLTTVGERLPGQHMRDDPVRPEAAVILT